ncbi:hypothetical protein N9993_00250 [bacterium]|jgi:hypothetical protein|nr:hypothetical protein [bacterium]
MARVNKAAAKPKKKTVRAVRRGANMLPLMPTKNLTWHKAHYYTHYEVESKEWLTRCKLYIKNKYDKKIVAAINKLPDWKVGGKSHWACAAYLIENDFSELVPKGHVTGLDKWILELAEEGAALVEEKKAVDKTKKNVYVPSIQERIAEQAQLACDDIEEWLDGFITNKKKFDPKGFDFTKHFASMKVTQAHARKIKKYYDNEYKEAQLIQKLPTPGEINREKDPLKSDMLAQLREGYSHLTKKDAKTYLEALETLHGACDLVIDAAKATRKPRKKAPPSKEKMIAKLKYLERDDKLQIVSVNPLELIDSKEVWVYNIKTRKLGKYVADEHATIRVKGTTLLHYNEKSSIQKTLRKPDETLKEFKKASKVKLRKFMDEIKTTDIKLNGRLNADTVILKVY